MAGNLGTGVGDMVLLESVTEDAVVENITKRFLKTKDIYVRVAGTSPALMLVLFFPAAGFRCEGGPHGGAAV